MADRSSDFTGNNYWESPGNVINPSNHPAHNMPTATEDHQGTSLPTNLSNDTSFMSKVGAIGRALSGRPGYAPEISK